MYRIDFISNTIQNFITIILTDHGTSLSLKKKKGTNCPKNYAVSKIEMLMKFTLQNLTLPAAS